VRAAAPVRGGRHAHARRLGGGAAEAASLLNGRARTCSRRRCSRTRRSTCCRAWSSARRRRRLHGATGPEAPLAGVPTSRCGATARRTCAARSSWASSGAASTSSPGSRAGDVLVVADEELDGVNVRSPPACAWSSSAPRSPRGPRAPTWCSRRPTWPRRRARSRTCAGACSASCRRRARRGCRARVVVLGDLLAAMGEGAGYWAASEVFDALAARTRASPGCRTTRSGSAGALVEQGAEAAEPARRGRRDAGRSARLLAGRDAGTSSARRRSSSRRS
jgi:hypothetical protein